MNNLQVNNATVPSECVEQMQAYLDTDHIDAQEIDGGHEGQVLGVPCRVNCEGAGKDSSLVIVAARPVEHARWNFGDCFPELPGASEEWSPGRLFRMRFLTLRNSLWLFIWGRNVQAAVVRERVAATAWFKEWAAQRGATETSEEGLEALFDTLGFDASELQADPHTSWRESDGGGESSAGDQDAKTSTSGLFLWGDVQQTSAVQPASRSSGREVEGLALLGDLEEFLGGPGLLFARVQVECEGAFPHLTLRLPPRGRDFGGDGLTFKNAAVYFSSVPYFTPQDTSVGLTGDFVFSGGQRIQIDLVYPIEGDLIWARGKYIEGPEHLLGDSASFGLPGTAPKFRADDEIALELEFSKCARTLTKLSFSIELHEKQWPLIPAPVSLALEGVSFHITILQPLDSSRMVFASLTAEATLGEPGDGQCRLVCGGSYPDGQLFLQSRESLPVGSLIEKLVGSSQGLEKLKFDDLRIDYNYIVKTFALEMDVAGPWEIVSGFEIRNMRFHVENGTEGYAGSLEATLKIAGVDVHLAAQNNGAAGGWTFQGNTGPGQEIPIGRLIKDLARKFGTAESIPPAIGDLVFENLAVSFDTGNHSFTFSGAAKLDVDGKQIDITVAVAVTRQDDGKYKNQFSGALAVGGAEFTLNFTSTSEKKVLEASWSSGDHGELNLKAISDDLPDLSDLETLLIPASATLTLDRSDGKTSLAIDCVHHSGAKAAFLLMQNSGAASPGRIAALGLKPGKISTASLGPLGSALRPHNLALDKLVIVAASADAPEELRLKLDEQEYPVSKGLLLQGALEFEGTSFSHRFECRLGGGESHGQPGALPAGDTSEKLPGETSPVHNQAGENGENSPAAGPTPEEGKNNVKVGRTIGPVTFRRARFESRDQRVYVLFDASLGSGGFELDLTGFNVNFPLTLFQDPDAGKIAVGLDGLSISYSKPRLTISGGFARTKVVPPYVDDLYQGHLLIKAEAFQIAVLGSYGNIRIHEDGEKEPSLFLYGVYDGVVGGPPAFFVTGLALGGGYNTQLALPPVEEVAEFPLVQAVTKPEDFTQDKLREAVKPSYGDYWLAVGVKFTSFKMADSFALFSVSFGTRLQFALLGLTKLAVPAGAPQGWCAAYAELAIRAVLDPDAGVLSIEGRLTNNSYVFSKEIRLTGGFAFFVWFGNAPEAGDFVISLGGYHPAFRAPSHYPIVPRVGIHAQLSRALSLTGEAYLALTPSCLMAGMKLEAVFQTGRIRATFVAYADFIVAWAPFHYDAQIGIGIAVAVRLWRTYKVELGASLHVWGPPFAGRARVSYWIVSFTVEFGDARGTRLPPLGWDAFQKAFLPPRRDAADHALLSTIRITTGLMREVKRDNEKATYRIVNPHELTIETDSAAPCSEVSVGTTTKSATDEIRLLLGIRPMGKKTLTSRHTVSIKRNDGSPVEDRFQVVQWSRKNYPEALWSANAASDKPEARMLKDVLSGVVLRVRPEEPKLHLGPFRIEKFKYESIDKEAIHWAQAPKEPTSIRCAFTEGLLRKTGLRDQIRACLATRPSKPGAAWNVIAMKKTSNNPKDFFQALPTCAALGQSL